MQTGIHLNTDGSINGRLLAQTAVTLKDTNTVVNPAAAEAAERILKVVSIAQDEYGEAAFYGRIASQVRYPHFSEEKLGVVPHARVSDKEARNG